MVSPETLFVVAGALRLANEIPRFELDRRGLRIEGHADRIAACGERLELLGSMRRIIRMPRSLWPKCSSEWMVIAPWPTCAS